MRCTECSPPQCPRRTRTHTPNTQIHTHPHTQSTQWDRITPDVHIPGLEGGAFNGLDALAKIAKAAWANDQLRSFIMAQLPVILGMVVKLAAASG